MCIYICVYFLGSHSLCSELKIPVLPWSRCWERIVSGAAVPARAGMKRLWCWPLQTGARSYCNHLAERDGQMAVGISHIVQISAGRGRTQTRSLQTEEVTILAQTWIERCLSSCGWRGWCSSAIAGCSSSWFVRWMTWMWWSCLRAENLLADPCLEIKRGTSCVASFSWRLLPQVIGAQDCLKLTRRWWLFGIKW